MAATGAEVHALEHDAGWYSKVMEAKQRFGLDSLTVHFVPLVQYEQGRWYQDAPLPWDTCDIVLCDGPPRQQGNRAVLVDVMQAKGAYPRCVVQDDITRVEFAPELSDYTFEVVGKIRQFVIGRRNVQIQLADNHQLRATG